MRAADTATTLLFLNGKLAPSTKHLIETGFKNMYLLCTAHSRSCSHLTLPTVLITIPGKIINIYRRSKLVLILTRLYLSYVLVTIL